MSDGRLSNQDKTEDEEPSKEGEYVAEKIFEMRTKFGHTEFLVQWKDYPSQRCTWAQAEDLNCPELIAQFFESQKQIIADGCMDEQCGSVDSVPQPRDVKSKKRSFLLISSERGDLGYKLLNASQVEEVLGVQKNEDGIEFAIKFRDDSVYLVPKDYAYDKFPDAILAFYESTIDWDGISVEKEV